jgi:hypothetical protein
VAKSVTLTMMAQADAYAGSLTEKMPPHIEAADRRGSGMELGVVTFPQ